VKATRQGQQQRKDQGQRPAQHWGEGVANGVRGNGREESPTGKRRTCRNVSTFRGLPDNARSGAL
jgi:hypothetical protein